MTKKSRSRKFIEDVVVHTPILKLTILLIVLWMLFAAGLYFAERGAEGTTITSYGRALYWGIAAFSTAGIADIPVNGISEIIGAIWIILGSTLFFGAIVATITGYFMRPLQRPSKQISNYPAHTRSSLLSGISSGKCRKYIHVGSLRHPCLRRFLQIHPITVTWLVF